MMRHAHAVYAIREQRLQEYLVEAEHERLIDRHRQTTPVKMGARSLRSLQLGRVMVAVRAFRFVAPLAFQG